MPNSHKVSLNGVSSSRSRSPYVYSIISQYSIRKIDTGLSKRQELDLNANDSSVPRCRVMQVRDVSLRLVVLQRASTHGNLKMTENERLDILKTNNNGE